MGGSHRAASSFLHRPDRHDSARRPGAHTPMVANDLFPGVQIAAEGKTIFSGPANRSRRSLIVPEEAPFDLIPMSDEEAAERELQSRRIFQSRGTLSAETEWTSATNTVFDGTYRHILGAASEKAKQRR